MVRTRGERIFGIFNAFILTVLAILMIYPFWDIVRVSFSTPSEAAMLKLSLWPKEPTLEAYRQVVRNEYIWNGYGNTIIRILFGMPIQMVLMILTAYPLSKKELPMRNLFTLLIVFTMFFSGGLIPNYLLIQKLGINNTLWALILPGAIPTYNMLILRNNFMTIPQSLEESARLDGAGTIRILVNIILPLSLPILMTVGLWGLVSHWNAWFDCIIYIRDPEMYTLQAVLRKIIVDAAPQFSDLSAVSEQEVKPSAEVVKSATIIVSTLPILVVYPFVQKYFVKGVMIGSLKG